MALELGQDVVDRGRRHIHLIERLHGGEPRGAAPVGLADVAALRARHHCARDRADSRRLIRTMASAARAASPPLSPSSIFARAQACASVSTVTMPLPSGRRCATDRSKSARADSIDTISKWMV